MLQFYSSKEISLASHFFSFTIPNTRPFSLSIGDAYPTKKKQTTTEKYFRFPQNKKIQRRANRRCKNELHFSPS